jgi:thioredoxin 2
MEGVERTMSVLVSDPQGVLVVCPSCGTRNRQHYANLNRQIRCGRCKTDLPPPSEPVEAADAASFDALIASTPVPVLVDFWAPWCGPCRMMAPEIEKVARRMAGAALVVKVNTDDVPELGERFGIRSIPTLAVFRHGREASRVAGARSASDIKTFVERA